jgi:hypothetical protein
MNASRASAAALLALVAVVGAGPLAAQGQTPTPPPPAEASAPATPVPNVATILNTGSTNTASYTITIDRQGKATVSVNGATPVSATVAKKLADKLFADIAATPALQSIANRGCMKSASFGTSTLLQYGGHVSPDLSCAGDGHGMALYGDIRAIEGALSLPSLMMRSSRSVQ